MIFPILLGATIFVYGCSDDQNVDSVDKDGATEQQTNSTSQQQEELEIVKTYEDDLGQLEAYYVNEEIEEKTGEQGVDLTVKYVEYGKVYVNDVNRNTYENMADADGKNTYIKVGIQISGDYEKFSDLTFFADQSSIETNKGKSVHADSTYSDRVAINAEVVSEPIEGYLYFLIDDQMPFESIKLTAPAPFKRADGLSISEDYVIKINLK